MANKSNSMGTKLPPKAAPDKPINIKFVGLYTEREFYNKYPDRLPCQYIAEHIEDNVVALYEYLEPKVEPMEVYIRRSKDNTFLVRQDGRNIADGISKESALALINELLNEES